MLWTVCMGFYLLLPKQCKILFSDFLGGLKTHDKKRGKGQDGTIFFKFLTCLIVYSFWHSRLPCRLLNMLYTVANSPWISNESRKCRSPPHLKVPEFINSDNGSLLVFSLTLLDLKDLWFIIDLTTSQSFMWVFIYLSKSINALIPLPTDSSQRKCQILFQHIKSFPELKASQPLHNEELCVKWLFLNIRWDSLAENLFSVLLRVVWTIESPAFMKKEAWPTCFFLCHVWHPWEGVAISMVYF